MGSSSAAKKAWRTMRARGIKPPRRGLPKISDVMGPKPKPRGSKPKKRKHHKQELWIGPAVKRPGALRAKIQKAFGKRGFDEKGRIEMRILQTIASGRSPSINDKRSRQQAQFALNVRRIGK